MELGDSDRTKALPVVTTATILGSQCGSLRVLRVEAPRVGLSSVEIAALSALTKLERLEVVVGEELFEDRAEALLWTVARLPMLLELVVSYQGTKDGADPNADCWFFGLPRCRKTSQLRSTSLTHITISIVGGQPEVNELCLVGLPRLQSCVIIAEGRVVANIRIDAQSFRGAPQLRELRIHGDRGLQLQLDSFIGLNMLTSLSFVACGLSKTPTAFATLRLPLRA